jgi:hypothetical protein
MGHPGKGRGCGDLAARRHGLVPEEAEELGAFRAEAVQISGIA